MFADERAIQRTLVSEQAGFQLDSSSYFSRPAIVASLTFGPTPSEHKQSRTKSSQLCRLFFFLIYSIIFTWITLHTILQGNINEYQIGQKTKQARGLFQIKGRFSSLFTNFCRITKYHCISHGSYRSTIKPNPKSLLKLRNCSTRIKNI